MANLPVIYLLILSLLLIPTIAAPEEDLVHIPIAGYNDHNGGPGCSSMIGTQLPIQAWFSRMDLFSWSKTRLVFTLTTTLGTKRPICCICRLLEGLDSAKDSGTILTMTIQQLKITTER